MKTLLRLEDLAMFVGFSALFFLAPYDWWWYLILILSPDLGMLGYLANARVGAFTYNLLHNRIVGVALLMTAAPMIYNAEYTSDWMYPVFAAGTIIMAHASLDRLFGYGLKYGDHFKHTHLGWLPGGEKAQ